MGYPVNINALDVRNEFILLDRAHKKMLIDKLDFRYRGYLVNIIQNQPHIKIPSKYAHILAEIKKIKDITPEISRINDKRTLITSLLRFLKNVLDCVALFFGIYTADKANSLVTKALAVDSSIRSKLNKVSERELKELIEKAKASPAKKLNLMESGFSPEISEMHFTADISFKGIKLEGVKFNDCTFDWTSFSESDLLNVAFENCELLNVSFCNTKLNTCGFSNCIIQEGLFTAANIENTLFLSTALIGSSFEDAKIHESGFGRVSMPGTHFLQADVKKSSIFDSNLTDVVFFGTAEQFFMDDKSKDSAHVTKPISNILVLPEWRGIVTPKAFMKLDKLAKALPLKVMMQAQTVTKEDVNREVEEALKAVALSDSELPIPQRLIKEIFEFPEKYPSSLAIFKKAESLSSELDAFFLVGGEDLPPALYGKDAHQETDWGNDYRRSLLELGMIHYALNKGIPLMGTCRGFQMMNVYFGASLIQDLKKRQGIESYDLDQKSKLGLYANAFDGTLKSGVAHHQGVPPKTPAEEYLEPVVIYDGLVKASELRAGASTPMILVQFHPEFYNADTADSFGMELVDAYLDVFMSKKNDTFWKMLSDGAVAYKAKKGLMEEIRDLGQKELSLDAFAEIERKRALIDEQHRIEFIPEYT